MEPSADPWRHAGFDELKTGNLVAAAELFSQAIEFSTPANQKHRHVFLSARSGARFGLGQWADKVAAADKAAAPPYCKLMRLP